MDPPSPGNTGSGGGGGDGAGASPSRPQSSSINQMAFCHECGIEIRPLMTPDPTCPRCNGQFVEIIEGGRLEDEEDDDEINNPFAPVGGDPFPGLTFRTGSTHGGGSLPQTLSSLLMAMASGAAPGNNAAGSRRDAQAQDPSHQQSNRNTAAEGQDADRNRQRSSSTTRSGTSSFGPFGLQWNVQYGSGGGDPYQEQYRRATEQPAEEQRRQPDLQSPPTLSNFLRFAFGGAESTDDTAQRQDTYFHDDGMGGAGGVADGRHFNHDNRGTYHQPPQSPSSDPAGRSNEGPRAGGGDGRNNNNDLPPELGALRNLFTGLFGEPGAHGGSLLDLLAAGAQGGAGGTRGQWGDYVLGQQGLDDIISQLMEQTQGSTAPPPATEDVIEKLERFTLHDKQRIEKARNQDCPTCKDEFLPSEGEAKEDDEGGEQQPQQEELISMPCGHIFHEDCLVPWLKLHGTCPVCRISIVKAREGQEEASGNNNSGNAAHATQSQEAQNDNAAATSSEPAPGGWPSPPNPFTSFFNGTPATGVQVPRDPSAATTTTTYHPLPPTSTTVTSTVYTTPAVAAGTPGLADVEVVNSIVSSPPIVSDREAYFDEQPDREGMRETLRRAAEARTRREQQPWLEPDELD